MSESKPALQQYSVPRVAECKYLQTQEAVIVALLIQSQRDKEAGLTTAGLVSGYRGSPLGGFDTKARRAQKYLNEANIIFRPAINEEQAAGHAWGTQQINLRQKSRYHGVFALWYGKGPGVDRSMDVLRHLVAAGVAPYGGEVFLAGDDPNADSSTITHESELALIHAGIPILVPSSPQEVFDFTLLAIAMSRFSGLPVALKIPTDLAEVSANIVVDPHYKIIIPDMPVMPGDDIYIRRGATPREQEAVKPKRILRAQAFANVNGINKIEHDVPRPRLSIAGVGRSYAEVMEALHLLGIDDARRQKLGIAIARFGAPWPLSAPSSVMTHLARSSAVLVVEGKTGIVEGQIKEALYGTGPSSPRIFGKTMLGEDSLPTTGVLTHGQIAKAIVRSLVECEIDDEELVRRAEALARIDAAAQSPSVSGIVRTPHYCSGCPHSVSTKNPPGAESWSGIGCHYMAEWMPEERRAESFTNMGLEGSTAVSELLFGNRKHVFQNLGDGTYAHSGSLAIREAVAQSEAFPGKGITYVILFNSVVAMTGGQEAEGGPITVAQLTQQLRAEGIKTIKVVAEDPKKYGWWRKGFAKGVRVYPRSKLLQVKEDLQKIEGVSVLIYDQVCATEKRRMRKRGTLSDPDVRVIINEDVCEGCGDCSKASNCPSVVPIQTAFGTKRKIDQSSCNRDFSCLEGFCPSFVKVKGAVPANRRSLARELAQRVIPEPVPPILTEVYNIQLEGIGGTGATTIGQILGQAAHLCGLFAYVLALAGLAQKGGSVKIPVRISPTRIHSTRIPYSEVNTMLGCDLTTVTSPQSLATLNKKSHVVVNLHKTPTSDFIHNPTLEFPGDKMLAALEKAVGTDHVHAIEATAYATELFGDSIVTNMLLFGYAYQLGLIPFKLEALIDAIKLISADVDMNLEAFACGRYAAAYPQEFENIGWKWKKKAEEKNIFFTRGGLVHRYASELEAYQSKTYADHYRATIDKVAKIDFRSDEATLGPLLEAAIKNLFKLEAYKDEYEVARLHTDGRLKRQLEREFSEYGTLTHSLAPPMMGTEKREFGPWIRVVMRHILSKLKFLRGTPLDLFGYSAHRKEERELIVWYKAILEEICQGLNESNYDSAVALAKLPEEIRGYGHVKQASIEKAKIKERAETLLQRFREKVVKVTP